MVGKQSANIMYGKVVGEAFALTTGPIDGHGVDATGRQVGVPDEVDEGEGARGDGPPPGRESRKMAPRMGLLAVDELVPDGLADWEPR